MARAFQYEVGDLRLGAHPIDVGIPMRQQQ